MASPVVCVSDTPLCPHGGRVVLTAGAPRVRIVGSPVALPVGAPVTGCALTGAPPPPAKVDTGEQHRFQAAPAPCLVVAWVRRSTRVFVQGQGVLLAEPDSGLLVPSQLPAIVAPSQQRVLAT